MEVKQAWEFITACRFRKRRKARKSRCLGTSGSRPQVEELMKLLVCRNPRQLKLLRTLSQVKIYLLNIYFLAFLLLLIRLPRESSLGEANERMRRQGGLSVHYKRDLPSPQSYTGVRGAPTSMEFGWSVSRWRLTSEVRDTTSEGATRHRHQHRHAPCAFVIEISRRYPQEDRSLVESVGDPVLSHKAVLGLASCSTGSSYRSLHLTSESHASLTGFLTPGPDRTAAHFLFKWRSVGSFHFRSSSHFWPPSAIFNDIFKTMD